MNHWILDDRIFDVFSSTCVRAALLDRRNYLISHSESTERLFFVDDRYDQLTAFNDFIYFDPVNPIPAWNRLVLSFHRKIQALHNYLSSELDLLHRQSVYWYFSVILLLYIGMETWDKATDFNSESEVFLSWCKEETMMCQYLIRRYSQSFYKEDYLKESIDGHWTSSTPNHPLNRYWYRGKSKYQNKERHLKRVHPDPIEGLSYNDPIDLEYYLEIASLIVD